MIPHEATSEQADQFRRAVANRDGEALKELVEGDTTALWGGVTKPMSVEDRNWAFGFTARMPK